MLILDHQTQSQIDEIFWLELRLPNILPHNKPDNPGASAL